MTSAYEGKSKNSKEVILVIFDCKTNYPKLWNSKQQTLSSPGF